MWTGRGAGAGVERRAPWFAPWRVASGWKRKCGASLRETVTELPGCGQRITEERFTRFEPRRGAVQSTFLDSTVVRTPSGGTIGQKIIGRTLGYGSATNNRSGYFRGEDFTLAMLHQPARQHGGAVFLDPLIHESNDFLAQVGDVAEPRQLVTLQTVARRRQQELPRRCRAWTGHGASFENRDVPP